MSSMTDTLLENHLPVSMDSWNEAWRLMNTTYSMAESSLLRAGTYAWVGSDIAFEPSESHSTMTRGDLLVPESVFPEVLRTWGTNYLFDLTRILVGHFPVQDKLGMQSARIDGLSFKSGLMQALGASYIPTPYSLCQIVETTQGNIFRLPIDIRTASKMIPIDEPFSLGRLFITNRMHSLGKRQM